MKYVFALINVFSLFFTLSSILFDIITVLPTLILLIFAWHSYFHPLIFNLLLSFFCRCILQAAYIRLLFFKPNWRVSVIQRHLNHSHLLILLIYLGLFLYLPFWGDFIYHKFLVFSPTSSIVYYYYYWINFHFILPSLMVLYTFNWLQ